MKNKGRTDLKYEVRRTAEGLSLRVHDFDLSAVLNGLAFSCAPLLLAYGWWHIPFRRLLGEFGLFPQLFGSGMLVVFAISFEIAQADDFCAKTFVFKHDLLVFRRNVFGFTRLRIYPLEKIYEFRATYPRHTSVPVLAIEAAGDFLIVASSIHKSAAQRIISDLLDAGMNPDFVTPVSQRNKSS